MSWLMKRLVNQVAWPKGTEFMWTENKKYLLRKFEFSSFDNAKDFVINVATLAKELNHHPKITWDFKKVQIELTTHDKGCITSLDYTLATNIDKILKSGFSS